MNTLVLTYDVLALRDAEDSFALKYAKDGIIKLKKNKDNADFRAAAYTLHHLDDTAPKSAENPPDLGSGPNPNVSVDYRPPDGLHVFKYKPCCRCTESILECDCIVGLRLSAIVFPDSKHWVVVESGDIVENKKKYFLGIVQSVTVEPVWPYHRCHFVVALHGRCFYRTNRKVAFLDREELKYDGYSVTLKALESGDRPDTCEYCGEASCDNHCPVHWLVQPPSRAAVVVA